MASGKERVVMWSEIKQTVKSASYHGGTIVPSGTYAAAPNFSSQVVIWPSANPRSAASVFTVTPQLDGQSITEILEESARRGDWRMFAEQIEAIDWSACHPTELIQTIRAALNQE